MEWICRGCVPDSSSVGVSSSQRGSAGSSSSTSSETKLISYNHEGTVILLAPDRIYLSSNNFSLKIEPLKTSDSGEFYCLVNEQRQPSVISRLLVQGKISCLLTARVNTCRHSYPFEKKSLLSFLRACRIFHTRVAFMIVYSAASFFYFHRCENHVFSDTFSHDRK